MGCEEVAPQGVQGIRPDRGRQIRGDPLGPDYQDERLHRPDLDHRDDLGRGHPVDSARNHRHQVGLVRFGHLVVCGKIPESVRGWAVPRRQFFRRRFYRNF